MSQNRAGGADGVYLLAPIDDAGAISRSYLLLVDAETDARGLLVELLGSDFRPLEVAGEEDALVFLRGGVVPSLLLVQLRISTAEAWVLADVIKEYPSFGTTTVADLERDGRADCLETLARLLAVCESAVKVN